MSGSAYNTLAETIASAEERGRREGMELVLAVVRAALPGTESDQMAAWSVLAAAARRWRWRDEDQQPFDQAPARTP